MNDIIDTEDVQPRRLKVNLSITLSHDEFDAVSAAATNAGMTTTHWVKYCALNASGHQDGFPTFEDIRELLDNVLSRQGQLSWWGTPMDKLDGSTPMDEYNAGHADRVYNVVAAYLDTSFS